MSRSGYTDGDCDSAEDFLRMCGWNANVQRCLRGRAGQAFLWELYQALTDLPRQELVVGALRDNEGNYCSLGAVARSRGLPIPTELIGTAEDDCPDEDEFEGIGGMFGIKDMLAREIMWQNDDAERLHEVPGPAEHRYGHVYRWENPHERWLRMRRWVVGKLKDIP